MKRFSDIPMADVEMVFPEKKIWLKPIMFIQLAATLIAEFGPNEEILIPLSNSGTGSSFRTSVKSMSLSCKRSPRAAVTDSKACLAAS